MTAATHPKMPAARGPVSLASRLPAAMNPAIRPIPPATATVRRGTDGTAHPMPRRATILPAPARSCTPTPAQATAPPARRPWTPAEEQAWDEPCTKPQHRQGRGQDPRTRRGDGPQCPCEHARLADPAAPLHDRRTALQLERPIHRLPANPLRGHRRDRGHHRHFGLGTGRSPSSRREVAAEIRLGSIIVLQVDAALQHAAEYATTSPTGSPFRPGRHRLPPGLRPTSRSGGVPLLHGHRVLELEAQPGFPVVGPTSPAKDPPWRGAHVARSCIGTGPVSRKQ